MPYIVLKSNDQLIDRRELLAPLVIGRAPGCDIIIRDILLSRRHCQLQPSDRGWIVTDLGSKNGTSVNGQKLNAPRLLEPNDVVRMGRTKLTFFEGILEEDEVIIPGPLRPTDPNESISGTLSGFTLLMPGESEIPKHMPAPRPRPREPAAFEKEDVHELLSAIASSSWDSIYAEVRQTAQAPSAVEDDAPRRRSRPRSPIDLSLQAAPLALVELPFGEEPGDAGPAPLANPIDIPETVLLQTPAQNSAGEQKEDSEGKSQPAIDITPSVKKIAGEAVEHADPIPAKAKRAAARRAGRLRYAATAAWILVGFLLFDAWTTFFAHPHPSASISPPVAVSSAPAPLELPSADLQQPLAGDLSGASDLDRSLAAGDDMGSDASAQPAPSSQHGITRAQAAKLGADLQQLGRSARHFLQDLIQ